MDEDPAWPVAAGEMAQRVREHDWARSPLGPVQQWPVSLRTTVQTLLAHPFATIVLWGPHLVQLYNDGYRTLMGTKHPAGLGQATRECWPEVWHINAPIYERVWRGESLSFEDALYPITRSGALEDAWFTLSYSPVHDDMGAVAGVLVTVFETTRRLRAEAALRESEARQAYLLELSDVLRPLGDPVAIQAEAARVLGEYLEAARVMYGEVSADGADLIVERNYVSAGTPVLSGRYRMLDFGPSLVEALSAGRPVAVPNLASAANLSAGEREAYTALGIAAIAGVPLTKQGRLVANLNVHFSAPRACAGSEMALIIETAERTWAAVERARAQTALRESEERLRLAVEVGELATWDWDMVTGRIVWSREHFRMQGYAVGEVEPSYEAWLARVHPDDRMVAEVAMRQALEQHQAYDHEFRTLLPDGSVHWMSAHGHFFHDHQGVPRRMIGVMRDITEQRNVRELLEHQIEQRTHVLRELLVRVESVQDDERRRIARELHDGLGQYLTAVTLAVGAFKDAPSDPLTRERVQRLNELMQHLDRELDRMVFLLRPTALEDCGLGDGVAAYVRSWSDLTGVIVDLELQGLDGDRLPTSVETAVFRIVQEALNNVAKHAKASRVSVSLERRRRHLVGSIEDNGVGFEVADASASTASRTHWGLVGMRERIEALGGTFAIESHPGRGTSVLLRVPLH